MSSKNDQSKSLFGGVVLFLLIGAFAYMAGTPKNQGGATVNQKPEGIDSGVNDHAQEDIDAVDSGSTPPSEGEVTGLVTLVKEGESSQILVNGQVVFTDTDEDWKIIEQLGLVEQGAVVKSNSNIEGDIFDIRLITLDGSGKSDLLFEGIDSFNTPVVNPNAKQIALTSFDNAERSFGFRLFSLDTSGSTTDIDQDETQIDLPLWRSNEELFYVVGGDGSQVIRLATLGLGSIDYVPVPTGEQVTALAWDEDMLYFATTGKTDQLYSFDYSDGKTKTVASNIGKMIAIYPNDQLIIATNAGIGQLSDGQLIELESEGELIGVEN